MIDSWYCWKCAKEVKSKYPKYWLHDDAIKPMSELKEDSKRKGYYLCKKHR